MQERLASVAEFDAAMAANELQAASELARQHVPLHGQLGIAIVDKGASGIVMTMELGDSVRGLADGSVHGGILATFADVASAFCLHGIYGADELPVTTDMHVRYYGQPRSGPLRAEAVVVHHGRRLLSTECSVSDGHGRVLSRSTATYMLVPRPASQAPPG